MSNSHDSSCTPPKTAPKPGKIQVYKALYAYNAQQPDELSFNEGDTVYVLENSEGVGWWSATCNGKRGLVPSNYISESTEAVEFPLHEAAKRGNMGFFIECLENKVSPNGLDKSGSTPLYWASHSGFVELVDILLELPNVNINAQNKIGDTAMHAAAWKGQQNIVEKLVEHGAKYDVKNYEGKTPLDLTKNPRVAAFLKRLDQRFSDMGVYSDSNSD